MDTVENVETAKKIIEVTVRDRVATHIGDDFYVCGNTEYEIHFDFDEEWDALDIKTARFIADGNVLYPDRIFSGNVCSFPDNPPISNTTSVRVGVFAGNLHTTTPARIPAVKSILCGTSTPAAPDEDAYHEAMEEMSKVATEARAQAAASAQSAEASAQSAAAADASAQDSAKAAETARQHSTDANAQAQAAAKSASDAASSASDAEAAKQAASAQADDAEESAKDAQTWAGRSEAFAGNAAASANKAGEYSAASAESAQAAASSATAASDSAKASAQSAADAAESVKDFFIVTAAEENGVLMASADAVTIMRMAGAGKVCLLVIPANARTYQYTGYANGAQFDAVAGSPFPSNFPGLWLVKATVADDRTVTFAEELPAKTPSPNKLTVTGGAEAEYDGSAPVSVEVPDVYVVKVNTNGKSDRTQKEIRAAVTAGKLCVLVYNDGRVYTYFGECVYILDGTYCPTFTAPMEYATGTGINLWQIQVLSDGSTSKNGNTAVKAPNPKKLTLTGAVEAEYDGSGAVSVEVPDVLAVKVGTDKKCSHTRQEIVRAVSSGKACTLVYYNGQNYQYSGLTTHNGVSTIPVFRLLAQASDGRWFSYKVLVLDDYETYFEGEVMSVRNPSSLRFTGAVEATYNGSEGVTVNIPEGGGAGLPETADPLKQLVTDADGKVAWEDRLAYKTTAEVENLAATELTPIDEDSDGTTDGFYLMSPWLVDLAADSVAAITYNGANYECKTIPYSALDPSAPDGMFLLGNLAAMGMEGIDGSNADAPFFLMVVSNALAPDMGTYGAAMPLDGAAAVTIAVNSVATEYKTIDKPYLPKQEALTFTGAVEATYDGSGPVSVEIPEAPTIPTTLPNPNKLTLTGAVSATYDGSSAVTVKIPTMPTIPTPTTSDAGKFLRVSTSGSYVLEALANAEEATF